MFDGPARVFPALVNDDVILDGIAQQRAEAQQAAGQVALLEFLKMTNKQIVFVELVLLASMWSYSIY